ncbi:type II restriction endonuclease [Halorubrum xinjiangense]|uniref:type II restriction endonuclease n=1 Tax=Halorubrum xinjiangense TaxID=261291 RepID=UPI003C7013B7
MADCRDSNDSSNDGDVEEFDFEDVLYEYFSDFDWDYTGILKNDGETIPIPKVSNCVTAIFEVDALNTAEEMAAELGATVIEPEHSRQYPDVTLRGGAFGDQLIALDVKTARLKSGGERISGMTLGSYGQYFSNPNTDTQWTRFPYAEFDEHWIVCFAYQWDDKLDSREMVYEVETIVGQKWELASRTSGSGTTTAIGSQTDMDALRHRDALFDSEEEFEEYWQEYGND